MTKPVTGDQKTVTKLGAKALRVSEPTEAELAKIKRRDIYIICDNILDTYNIGSIFRLADAVAAKGVYLCGESEVPPNIKIHRAAVGTDKWVPWQYFATAKEAIEDLRKQFSSKVVIPALHLSFPRHPRDGLPLEGKRESIQGKLAGIRKGKILDRVENDTGGGIKIFAIEQSKRSRDFRKVEFWEPIAFVVGHETTGVSKETLKVCDEIVEIPMYGVNVSLNVMVSLAIVLYRV